MIHFTDFERLTAEEYIDFLKRTDLGSQYPKQGFEERIPKLLKNVDLSITARTSDGKLVGVCLGLTDFVYFLFLTDLGVDRDYIKQGIGSSLVKRAHQLAGGEANITITTISNDLAIDFYSKLGMKTQPDLVVKFCTDWEDFIVE
ncbi:MAG TPA: GNAT family N-acetyltransferase [Fimbriimonas sp.]|nr:GNAT family N-acetyltransferase [Fimbriimonas sp.]